MSAVCNDDVEVVNKIMDEVREATSGFAPEHIAAAIAGLLGELAINATQGNVEAADSIVSDVLRGVRQTLQDGAAQIAALRQGGAN